MYTYASQLLKCVMALYTLYIVNKAGTLVFNKACEIFVDSALNGWQRVPCYKA